MEEKQQRLTANQVIKKLGLVPLPEEGGFFRETYRSAVRFQAAMGDRCSSTCIYYLLTEDEFSALHKVKSTEIFHFYAGDSVEMFRFKNNEDAERITIGNQLHLGETPQVIVEKDTWQGTKLIKGGKWALLGCTVSPGFEFADFEIDDRKRLIEDYPALQTTIIEFTR